MCRYIDAEILYREVDRLMAHYATAEKEMEDDVELSIFYQGKRKMCSEIINFITSLQYEQPKVDLVAELKHHFDTTPKEQLEKEWKELEPWTNVGPTVHEFLYGKQSEVDLEKEIEEHAIHMPHGEFASDNERQEDVEWAKEEFLHFYELGLNARKEE